MHVYEREKKYLQELDENKKVFEDFILQNEKIINEYLLLKQLANDGTFEVVECDFCNKKGIKGVTNHKFSHIEYENGHEMNSWYICSFGCFEKMKEEAYETSHDNGYFASSGGVVYHGINENEDIFNQNLSFVASDN